MDSDLQPPPRHPLSAKPASAAPPSHLPTVVAPARRSGTAAPAPDAHQQQPVAAPVIQVSQVKGANEKDDVPQPELDKLAAEIVSSLPPPSRRSAAQQRERSQSASSKQPLTPESAALKELEDEEIANFLSRVGRRVQNVQVELKDALPPASKQDFRLRDGRTAWQAYLIAQATVWVHNHVPISLLVEPRDGFSFTLARQHTERLYTCFPRSSWEHLLDGYVVQLYRWEHPHAIRWLGLYCLLWIWDLIPILPLAVFLWYLLRARWFPPSPAELFAAAQVRRARAKEASELSKSMRVSSKVGFVLDGARSLVKSKLSDPFEAEGGALAKGLSGSTRLATAYGRSPPSSPPAASASTPAAQQSQNVQAEEEKEKDVSLYRLGVDARDRFGPTAQVYMGDAADLAEMCRNLFLHPEHPSVPSICWRLFVIMVVLHFVPRWIQYKAAWAYLGVEFFALWKLREDLPKWRRALTPIWWLFLGAPTDAELATYLLRKRALTGDVGIGGRDRAGSYLSASSVSMSSRPSSIRSLGEDVLSVHFAIVDATPGDAVLTPDTITFMPTKGFRTLSRRARVSLSSSSSSDGGGVGHGARERAETIASFLKEDKSVLFEVALGDVVAVKKTSKLGTRGISLTTKTDKEWKLMNVSRRDELFNKIVANSEQLTT